MPSKEHYEKYYKNKYPKKEKANDAVSWLKDHPEDIPLARENLAARDKGFDNEGARQLMAAICLQACKDYKRANGPYSKDTQISKKKREECEEFFGGDIFQFFVNGLISVDQIARTIVETDIRAEALRLAKNATPIIEEQCDEQGSLLF